MSSDIEVTFRPLEGHALPSYEDMKFFLDSAEYKNYDDFDISEKSGFISIFDTKYPEAWSHLAWTLSQHFPNLEVEQIEEWDDEGPGGLGEVYIAGKLIRKGELAWKWEDLKLISE